MPNQNPFSLLVAHEDSVPYLKIGASDYTQTILLPEPMDIDGTDYHVAMMARSGHLVLVNTDPSSPKRFHVLTQRPSGNCQGKSGQRSTMVLAPSGKELIVIGGFKGSQYDLQDQDLECDVSRRADFFHLEHHSWFSVDLGIARQFPTATLLPTGAIFIANGGGVEVPSGKRAEPRNPGVDLRAFPNITNVQLLDPEIQYAYDLGPAPDDYLARGYHNIALLTKDARVYISGGLSLDGPHGVGSERPDFRFYEPGYLHQGPRPEWGDMQEPIVMEVGGAPIEIPYVVPEQLPGKEPLKEKGGGVLMATGSFTHHFDHNQRYIPLDYEHSNGMLKITPPATTSIAPRGDYILYLVRPAGLPKGVPKFVTDFGIPSVGKHVVLK